MTETHTKTEARIMSPVSYSSDMLDVITKYDSLDEKKSDDWSDNEVNVIKYHAKSHYISEQKNHCCYCRMPIHSKNHAVWDLEHIVARTQRPEFMFTPENLAVSCKDCNLAKGTINVLVNTRRKTYPNKSDDFLIVHPHLDDYYSHIYKRGFVYQPMKNSSKGKFTIYHCDLLRFVEKFVDLPRLKDLDYEKEAEELLSSL